MNTTETLIAIKVASHEDGEVLAEIVARIHISQEMHGLQLEREFYRTPITGVHHELELLGPEEIVERRFLHIHKSDDGRPFVCYPAALPTLEEAVHVLRVWSAGTVHTIAGGADLNETLKAAGGMDAFLDWIKEQHGITTSHELR